MTRLPSRRLGRWLLGGIVALAIVVVGGTWLYIHVIEGPAPAPLSLRSGSTASPSAAAASAGGGTESAASVAGDWQVAAGSVVGYRVNEVLAGQNNVAVGRTGHVSGSMTIDGSSVTAASFTVQMATIHSDQSERDAQFDGRIMDTASYPTGALTLTTPINLGAVPADGVVRSYQATANLTLHGHTR
jgi:polyisoprenoid-binding protein YceI